VFFVLSKTIGFLLVPTNLLIALGLLGALFYCTRLARPGARAYGDQRRSSRDRGRLLQWQDVRTLSQALRWQGAFLRHYVCQTRDYRHRPNRPIRFSTRNRVPHTR
jgi:hypothetical protein